MSIFPPVGLTMTNPETTLVGFHVG